MIKDTIIQGIFSEPVYKSSINRPILKIEKIFLKKCSKDKFKNEGNYASLDTYILNQEPFKKLKKELQKHIDEYVEKIYTPEKKTKLYITQSWLNYTNETEYHHAHQHPNSIVSGVFYFDADIKFDSIQFHRLDSKRTIQIVPREYHHFNSDSWVFEVETGDLVLFPSYLKHNVKNKKGKNTRISLAFNTFVKGTIGSFRKLTELKL